MMNLQDFFPSYEINQDAHKALLERFTQVVARADIGFFKLSTDKGIATTAKTTARRFAHKKLLVHVGIGGSALGPEMLLSALGVSQGKQVQFINNIDPDILARQQKEWTKENTLFYIVSKSGTTAETVAALSIITSWLTKNGVSVNDWKEHIVICTDPQKGDLRLFAREHYLSCLDVPANIGGRFSVLSDVGLFPAAWAGINVDQLLLGAEQIRSTLTHSNPKLNLLTQTALWIDDHQKNGKVLTVLMPYSSLLKDFTAWWVQLWAESLGKDGKGLTPIMAYGATDQHSQMQLFMQGPADKVMLMINVAKHPQDFNLQNSLNFASARALAPFTLSQLLEAEFTGTLKALKEANRTYAHLQLDEINASTLGGVILFFESLTVAVGILLGIDPFNQPGVEAGKKYAQEWLSLHRP